VWGLQEANDALWRSSWPTVLAPNAQGFGIGANPSDINASCTFTATFTANAYRTGRWEDPITVAWQKADKNADTPLTGNPWVGDDPQTWWNDLPYANAPAPVPYPRVINTPVPINPAGDPYFKNVALLMSMDSGFTDASINNRTFSVVSGAAIQTAVKKNGTGSAEFNGTSGFAVTNNTTNMSFGTSDFTIESWVYLRSDSRSGCIIAEQHVGNPISIAFGFHGPSGFEDTGRRLFFGSWNGWWQIHITADTDIPLNQWVHVAVTRSSNYIYLFYNGSIVGFTTTGFTIANPTMGYNIGKRWDNTASSPYLLDGYIDDLRVTIGVARYTANFVPPVAPFPTTVGADPAFSQVTMLLPMTGANNSITFTDVATTPNIFTRNGNTKISTVVTPENVSGSAGLFDGNGDYLTTSGGSQFTFNGDFTIEGWFRFANNTKGYQPLITTHSNADATGWTLILESNNRLYFYAAQQAWWGNYWGIGADTGITPPINKWVHIAVTRRNGYLQIFFGGRAVYGTTYTAQIYSGNTLEVGEYAGVWGNGTGRGFDGYMSQLRITNGTARYTADFTSPALAFPTSWSDPDPYAADVVVLANFETGPRDSSSNNFPSVMSSSGAITPNNKKFGSYSLSNGSVGFVGDTTLPASFTIEGWYYFNTITTKRYLFSTGTLGVNLTDLYMETGKLYLQINGGSPQTLPGTQHVQSGSWTHIALVRNVAAATAVIRCYVDGVYLGDFNSSDPVGDTTVARSLYVFAAQNDYTDEFRVTRAARYTAAFIPPTEPFNNGNTVTSLVVNNAGKRAVNGTYYPAVASNNSYNLKQFYRKSDNLYCLFWYNGYWLIHEADSNGNPSGTWQYYSDGYNWKTIQTYPLQYSQPLNASLTLNNLTFADNATYYRIAARSGFQEAVSSAALLTVEPLSIQFTVEPQDTTINSSVTGSVTFTASALGIGRTTGQTYSSFTYQWQKKGLDGGWQDIPFATGTSVTDTALTPGTDNGNQYRVRAGCGSTNIGFSRAALLTVI